MCRVVARVRPAQDFELQRGDAIAAYPADSKTLRLISAPKPGATGNHPHQQGIETNSFSFDHVFGGSATQAEVYEKVDMSSCCEAALQGHGVTVLATGISSAGKTFTLSGPPSTTSLLWDHVDTGLVTEQFERYVDDGGLLFSPSRHSHRQHHQQQQQQEEASSCDPTFRTAFDTLGLQFRAGVYLVRRVSELAAQVAAGGDGSPPPIILKACMYEIYNEQVFDLLNPSTEISSNPSSPTSESRKSLKVRMNPATGGGTFFVEGLMVVTLTSLEDLFAVLAEGDKNRKRSTVSDSTRSHVVFSLGVENFADPDVPKTGKVNFVDLAGSERPESRTLYHRQHHHNNNQQPPTDPLLAPPGRLSVKAGAFADQQTMSTPREIEQLSETKSINKSLFTLGKVISALAANSHHNNNNLQQQQQQFVPFRDSTLTKLLSDSLSGSALILLLACVTPTSRFLDETRNTLNYATTARSITAFRQATAAAGSRIDAGDRGGAHLREMMQLKREVEWLRRENAELRLCLSASNEEKQATQIKLEQMKREFEEQQQQPHQQQIVQEKKKMGLFANFESSSSGLGARSGSIAQPLDASTSMILAPMNDDEDGDDGGGDQQQQQHQHQHESDQSYAESDYLRGFDDGHSAAVKTISKQQPQQKSPPPPPQYDEEEEAAATSNNNSSSSARRSLGDTQDTAADTLVLRSEIDELRRLVLDLSSRIPVQQALPAPAQQQQQQQPVQREAPVAAAAPAAASSPVISLFGGGGGGQQRPSSGSVKPLSLGSLVE